jgi:hypothetical protein
MRHNLVAAVLGILAFVSNPVAAEPTLDLQSGVGVNAPEATSYHPEPSASTAKGTTRIDEQDAVFTFNP